MKRMIARFLVALTVIATLAAPGVAQAQGNWAVTYLDPAPARFSPGTPSTLGFWVLQHGTHPFWGDDIGEIALRFTDGEGGTHTFPGVELKEAAHYAAAIVLPEGTWRMQGVLGRFEPYEIGTLTVPGGLKVNPLPEVTPEPGKDYWAEIRPPGFPAGKGTTTLPVTGVVADTSAAVATTTAAVVEPATPWWRSPAAAAVAVSLLAAVTVLAAPRLRRRGSGRS